MTRDELKQAEWIVILNDDETYTDLHGCTMAIVDDDAGQELDGGNDAVLETLPKCDMATLLIWAIDRGFFDDEQPVLPLNC